MVVPTDCWIVGCYWLTPNVAIAQIHVLISRKFPVAWMMEIQIHVPPHLLVAFLSAVPVLHHSTCLNDDKCVTSTDSAQFRP